jgi:hypothetical protein
VSISCEGAPGERDVTLEAVGHDAAPLVIVPVYCGMPAPASLQAEPPANVEGATTADAVARRLAAIVERERVHAALPRLRRDPRVEQAAAAHAADRAADRTGDPAKRLREAGVRGARSSFTVFHVGSLASAVERITGAPAELAKLRDPVFTTLGIGVVPASDGFWITVAYLAIPPPVDAPAAEARIVAEIRGMHVHTVLDPDATEVAQRVATGLAAGGNRDRLKLEALSTLKVNKGVADLDMAIEDRFEMSSLDIAELVGDRAFHAVGVAVAQSPQTSALAGTIWVVVVFLR